VGKLREGWKVPLVLTGVKMLVLLEAPEQLDAGRRRCPIPCRAAQSLPRPRETLAFGAASQVDREAASQTGPPLGIQ